MNAKLPRAIALPRAALPQRAGQCWERGLLLALAACGTALISPPAVRADALPATGLFARTNLLAWCIVPFDAKKRGPEERAAMLEQLGITQLAYDYRAEHIPTFDAEMEALRRHRIRLRAWWFPGALNDEARLILDVLRRHELRGVQLWVTGGGPPTAAAEEQQRRVEAEAERLRPLANEAAKLGGHLALYNHGGWFGEPDNQLAIIQLLHARGVTNVGIVYNQHHGHDHVDRFAELFQRMKPHLLALNLNGMTREGDRRGKKILPLGEGELDLPLLRIVRDSGWQGPLGLLNHTDEDAEVRLRANLRGLERLVKQLEGNARGRIEPGRRTGPRASGARWIAPRPARRFADKAPNQIPRRAVGECWRRRGGPERRCSLVLGAFS